MGVSFYFLNKREIHKMKLLLAPSFLLTLTAATNQCGRVGRSRIVGGTEAYRGAHPWQISLRNDKDSTHRCGGSIISERWILTAAHCLKAGNDYAVAIGAHELNSQGRGIIDTVKTVIHPEYNDNTYDNDIALLKLSKKIHFGAKVQPICLHEASLPSPRQVTISGWGTTSSGGQLSKVLKEVKVPMVSDRKCREHYGNRLTGNMICAGSPKGGQDSCQGDSGGPMSYRDMKNHRWVQIGVVSWGDGCGLVGVPGIYADVSKYTDWIDRETSDKPQLPPPPPAPESDEDKYDYTYTNYDTTANMTLSTTAHTTMYTSYDELEVETFYFDEYEGTPTNGTYGGEYQYYDELDWYQSGFDAIGDMYSDRNGYYDGILDYDDDSFAHNHNYYY